MNLIKSSSLALGLCLSLNTLTSDTGSTVSTNLKYSLKRKGTPGTICCDRGARAGVVSCLETKCTISTTDLTARSYVPDIISPDRIRLLNARNYAYSEIQKTTIYSSLPPETVESIITDSVKTGNRINSKEKIAESIIINCMLEEDKMGLL